MTTLTDLEILKKKNNSEKYSDKDYYLTAGMDRFSSALSQSKLVLIH